MIQLGSEDHTVALASPCTASYMQQASTWFCMCSSLGSHIQHVTRQNQPPDWEDTVQPWGETNSSCERNIVKGYCWFPFLSGRKLCLFHVLIV